MEKKLCRRERGNWAGEVKVFIDEPPGGFDGRGGECGSGLGRGVAMDARGKEG